MPTPSESQAALRLVTGAAVADGAALAARLSGSPEAQRAVLLDAVPAVVGYYSDGSAALAADFYEEQREAAGLRGFRASPIVNDRTVKIRRAVAWASEPLFEVTETTVAQRLAEVIQLETARPYRDTITGNRRLDPASVGWQRVTGTCCRFCRMLGDRGAVYREATARFAAHPNCDCTAQPVFQGGQVGPEASTIQYVASRRSKTPAQKKAVKDYLDTFYPN